MSESTIAAISTAIGEGGLSVIRISGENAIAVADRVFRAASEKPLSALAGYRAAYGTVQDGETVLDDAVALVFRAPKSYTGEDVVEISLHGGRLIARKVLRLILQNGARLASGGEFTKRAFLNGKIDLTEAESVMGLISAQSEAALRISRAAHDGKLSRAIRSITDKLLETGASFAAYADYPDEDIPDLSPERFGALLNETQQKITQLLSTYDAGRILREGVSCAIVGKPNVGKSTLMNLLSGNERSIVTEIAGTTRDVIEDTVTVGDVVLRLSDTAGIHDTADPVEKVGVDRAKKTMENADLILAVFDSSVEADDDDHTLIAALDPTHTLVLLNKTDLPNRTDPALFEGFTCISLSAKEGNGVDELTEEIGKITRTASLSPDDAVLLNERQRACVARADDAVREAADAFFGGATLDAVGVCIDDALSALLELTGERVTDAVTDEVFRRFCVGK